MKLPTRTHIGFLGLVTVGVCIGHVGVARAHCLLNTRWPGGRVQVSHNFPPSGPLINGTNSWEANAESAMREWSTVSDAFRFISGGSVTAGQNHRDGLNNILFSDNLDGNPFDPDLLALTFTRTDSAGDGIESDIVFNSEVRWNAYNGPIRIDRDEMPIFDFRRVLLHELGHVLGLDHPDNVCGQSVDSIMNARTTDTDQLTNDDRNALSFLYADGNQPPIADAGPDQIGNGIDPFELNAGRSSDPDGVIVSYQWRMNGEAVATGTVVEINLHFGTHVIALTVTDEDGAAATDTVIVAVGNVPPATDPDNLPPIADGGADRSVPSGQVVILDATGSADPDGTIDRYVWSEGSFILGRNVIVPIALSIGTHSINLTVFDDDGAADSDAIVVTVVFGEAVDTGPIVEITLTERSPTLPLACGAIGWTTLLVAFAMYGFWAAFPTLLNTWTAAVRVR